MLSMRGPLRVNNSSASQGNPGQKAPEISVSSNPKLPAKIVVNSTSLGAVLEDATLATRRVHFHPGEQICSADEAAKNVFLIHRGQVRLYQPGQAGSIRLIDVLGRDQWFGIASLAKASNYDCQAVAVTPTIVSEIPADKLLAALLKRPEIMAEVTRDLAKSVLAARAETSRLMFDDCSQRLTDALLRLSSTAAATQREDGVVLHMTHSQLAQSVGAARETVSLALTQLRRQSLIRTGRNQLFFNPELLRRSQTSAKSATAPAA